MSDHDLTSQTRAGLRQLVPKLLEYQLAWVVDEAQTAIAEKSRRIGFTYAEAYKSVERRLKLGTDHLFASRTKDTAAEFIEYCKTFARMFRAAARVMEVDDTLVSDSDMKATMIRFDNGARIIALSSHPDAFRGFGGDVTLDEFAFHRDQRGVLKGARAAAVVWGHQLRIISTHNGEGSLFNQIIGQIAAGKLGWSHHRVTLQDAVDAGLVELIKASKVDDREEQHRIRTTIDRDARQQFIDNIRSECVTLDEWYEEYCCIPNSDASAYLPYELIDNCTDPSLRLVHSIDDLPNGELYAGYDVGRRRDLSAFWVLELLGDVYHTRMLRVLTGEDRKWSSQERLLDTALARPNIRRLCIDQTGMGEQLAEQRVDRWGGYRVEGVILTGSNKAAIAGPFKGLFEDRRIRIPADDALREDLHKTRKVVTAAGNVRLQATSDDDGHADRFWAGALASHATTTQCVPGIEFI